MTRQREAIPVFLKQGPNAWVYDGDYRVKGLVEERAYIERKQQRANRSDVILVLLMEPVEGLRPTYLLTWNPHNWPWADLEAMVERTALGEPVYDHWSCGNTKRIRPGDRLFPMRQGAEPRGVMAAGWATSATYQGPHWDEARRERGDTALRLDLLYERILHPDFDEILLLDKLQTGPLASMNWATPASGIQIKQGVDDLERLWSALVGVYESARLGGEQAGAVEGKVRVALARHRTRERWLRDEKISQVSAANGGRLPCQVCGFDFLDAYGELGRDYAQVHHLNPLGDLTKPSLTRLADLAVVCANCHVMIHRGGAVRPMDELRRDSPTTAMKSP